MTKIHLLLDCSAEYSDMEWAVVWLDQETIDRIHLTHDRIQGEEKTVMQAITFAPFAGISAYQDGTDSLRELEDFVTRRSEGNSRRSEGDYSLKSLEKEGRAYLLSRDELKEMVQQDDERRLECVHIEVYRTGTVQVQFSERHVDRDHRTFGFEVKGLPRSERALPRPLTMLDISTAHMPNQKPNWGALTVSSDDAAKEGESYFSMILVQGGLDDRERVNLIPEWLRPIHDFAVKHDYFALWFSPDGDVYDAFAKYDW